MQVRFVMDKIRSSCVLLLAAGVSDDREEQHERFYSISIQVLHLEMRACVHVCVRCACI